MLASGESIRLLESVTLIWKRTRISNSRIDCRSMQRETLFMVSHQSSVWSPRAYLKASNTGAEDYFGQSISLSGDTLAVGAIGEDSNATGVGGNQADDSASGSGAVYVFR